VAAGGAEAGATDLSSTGGFVPEGGTLAQLASSVPTMAAIQGLQRMWLILLEALGALALLLFIVWWTMFSGRKKGERDDGKP
jgi:hypothetical protein